jgi:hypothetical protein
MDDSARRKARPIARLLDAAHLDLDARLACSQPLRTFSQRITCNRLQRRFSVPCASIGVCSIPKITIW